MADLETKKQSLPRFPWTTWPRTHYAKFEGAANQLTGSQLHEEIVARQKSDPFTRMIKSALLISPFLVTGIAYTFKETNNFELMGCMLIAGIIIGMTATIGPTAVSASELDILLGEREARQSSSTAFFTH